MEKKKSKASSKTSNRLNQRDTSTIMIKPGSFIPKRSENENENDPITLLCKNIDKNMDNYSDEQIIMLTNITHLIKEELEKKIN